jgi:hypothetical protein
VVDATGADLVVRTYLEQAARKTTLAGGCDIGAGYGRMSCVLQELRNPARLNSTFVVMPLRFPRPGGWCGILRVLAARSPAPGWRPGRPKTPYHRQVTASACAVAVFW